MFLRRLALLCALLSVGVAIVFISQAATAAGPSKVVQVQFVTDSQAGYPVQDIFVERNDIRPDQVARLVAADARSGDAQKPAFASSSAAARDPFKVRARPFGPFPKGRPLGFTVQQYLAASGSGTYTVSGNQADMKFSFQNLVPDATYTVWFSQLRTLPAVMHVDIPLGIKDSGATTFQSDPQGNASFSLKTKALPESAPGLATVIGIVYHSDGQTHEGSQGDFGLNSHTQLTYVFPSAQPFFTPVPPTPAPPPTVAPGHHGAGQVCGSCHRV